MFLITEFLVITYINWLKNSLLMSCSFMKSLLWWKTQCVRLKNWILTFIYQSVKIRRLLPAHTHPNLISPPLHSDLIKYSFKQQSSGPKFLNPNSAQNMASILDQKTLRNKYTSALWPSQCAAHGKQEPGTLRPSPAAALWSPGNRHHGQTGFLPLCYHHHHDAFKSKALWFKVLWKHRK